MYDSPWLCADLACEKVIPDECYSKPNETLGHVSYNKIKTSGAKGTGCFSVIIV